MAKQIPNPGSDEACNAGCTCPVLDNLHGKGFPYGGCSEPKFWVDAKCPLHAAQSKKKV